MISPDRRESQPASPPEEDSGLDQRAEQLQRPQRPISLHEAGLLVKSDHPELLRKNLTDAEQQHICQAKERLLQTFDRYPHLTPRQFDQSVFYTAMTVLLENLTDAVRDNPSLCTRPDDVAQKHDLDEFFVTLQEATLFLRMFLPPLPLSQAENDLVQAMILRFVHETGNYAGDQIQLDTGSYLRVMDELHTISLQKIFEYLDSNQL